MSKKLNLFDSISVFEIIPFLREHSIGEDDRLLFVGEDNINICLHLYQNGFKKLYLVSRDVNVYDNAYYTEIRYIYEWDRRLHFPDYFFKVVFSNNKYENLRNLVDDEGYFFEENLSKEQIDKNKVKSRTENVAKIKTMMSNGASARNAVTGNEKKFSVYKVFQANLKRKLPNSIDILCYHREREGILIYSELLKFRLKKELAIDAEIVSSVSSVSSSFVIIEFHASYGHLDILTGDIMQLLSENKHVILENHGSLKLLGASLDELIKKGLIVTYRSPEIAEFDKVNRYTLVPLISYMNITYHDAWSTDTPILGTFGYLGNRKGTDEIIYLSAKLKLHSTILLGISPDDSKSTLRINSFINRYSKNRKLTIDVNGENVSEHGGAPIKIHIGNHSDEDIIKYMAGCSHIVFAHRQRMEQSGTMTYAKRLSRPIFALDSFQSRIGQVYRYKKFTGLTPLLLLRDDLVEMIFELLNGRLSIPEFIKIFATSLVKNMQCIFSKDKPTLDDLLKMKASNIRDEDGFEYIVSLMSSLFQRLPESES